MARESLERDPTMMNALWVEAFGSHEGYVYQLGDAPEDLLVRPGRAADRLLDLDSSDPRSYTAWALVIAWTRPRQDALAQVGFADGALQDCERWARLAIQMHPRAPIRQALMAACLVLNGDRDAAGRHMSDLSGFAPDFVPSVLG